MTQPTAAALIAAIQPTPEATLNRWPLLDDAALREIDWSDFLLLAVQHRVEGLALETLHAASYSDALSPAVLSMLRRRADMADARFQANYHALVELHGLDAELVGSLVLFKGATLVPLYESSSFRLLGDFDVIVAAEFAPRLGSLLEQLGYWEKLGKNGPTYFKANTGYAIGCEYVCIDVHLTTPVKYDRTDKTMSHLWLDSAQPYELGDVSCRKLLPELELIELLNHIHEHAASWIHATLEDDLRLTRLLDVEVLLSQHRVDADEFVRLLNEVGLEPEVLLGLWQFRELRGVLPDPFSQLEATVNVVGEFGEAYALPDGRIDYWDVPIVERAFRSDRSALALSVAPDGRGRRDVWFDWKKGLLLGSEPVAEIAAKSRARLAESRRGLATDL